jgi:hypothetical protein
MQQPVQRLKNRKQKIARKLVTGITKLVHTALELRRTYKIAKQFQGSQGRLCHKPSTTQERRKGARKRSETLKHVKFRLCNNHLRRKKGRKGARKARENLEARKLRPPRLGLNK